jgi:hypothetical protein
MKNAYNIYKKCSEERSMYMESKRERFKRIAENRTNKIINMIDLLGNCSNKNNYDYTDEDVKNIFNAIENSLKISKMKFAEKQEKGKFKL